MSQILLLEDDDSLGDILQERLTKEGHQVTWVRLQKEAEVRLRSEIFDLAVLDIGVPDGSGLELAAQIKKEFRIPFIFVTAQTSAEIRLKGYELGAEEFIPKPFHLKEFLIRLNHVLTNHARPAQFELDGVVLNAQNLSLDFESGDVRTLSKSDFESLRLLLSRAPAVVSRDDIINQVWGQDAVPSPRTIDNCMARLRATLGEGLGDNIQAVRGVGYQWKGYVRVK